MTDIHAKPAAVKIAVATKGLGQVDLHFGHADDFHIYEAGPGGIRYIEKRLVEHYCQGGFGDEDKREVIVRALADCTGLLVAKIGDGPKKRLQEAGIEAVDDYAYGATEDAVKAWYEKRMEHDKSASP
jgi:predicted Fe-Mo cluster-binding NifX family protein